MKKLVSIALVLVICSPCFLAGDKPKKEKIAITEQEYAVYEAVGVRNYEYETSNRAFGEDLRSEFPSISSELIADYAEKNSKTYLLRWVLRNGQQKKLPKSHDGTSSNSFSRIGFNKDETEALVYTGWEGLGNNCEYDFFHLKKEDDKWAVVKKVMLVIC